jgi:hypothetical protein
VGKPKVWPLDIWESEGAYYSKGHHLEEEFVARMKTQYGLEISMGPECEVGYAHARWMPPGSYDNFSVRPFLFCEPGPGAFPVTYWRNDG